MRENLLWWGRDRNAKYPRLKVFLSKSEGRLVPIDLWDHKTSGTTDEGGQEVKGLFGEAVFDNPKPTKLISRMLRLCTTPENDDIVLDFFAGSCTTAQSLLHLNREDGGNRRFVMVQLPELTPEDSVARRTNYDTIAEIGKDRIRRAIYRMQADDADKFATTRSTQEDLGFRVFKLERSNYKAWRDYGGEDMAALQARFDSFESPLVDGWKPEDLLIEVLLMEGFPLDSSVTELPGFTQNKVLQIASDMIAHRLFVCLDDKVADATIAALTMGEEDVFICLDSALSDEAKVRLEDGRRVKVI